MARTSIVRLLAFLLALAAGGAATAAAQCSNAAVNSGQSVTVTTSPQRIRFHEHMMGWNAAGVRSGAGSDWNLSTYSGTASFPGCVSGFLAGSSQSSGVDLVLGDLDYKPFTDYYMQLTRASGTGPATLEWEVGGNFIVVDQPAILMESDSTDVVSVWNIELTAGAPVAFVIDRHGAADLRLLLFEVANQTGGETWLPRSARAVEATASFDYTPPVSGIYGVVFVNENGAAGTCMARVVSLTTAAGDGMGNASTGLLPPRPNPARQGITIDFELAANARVGFELLDSAGRVVTRSAERMFAAGRRTQSWTGTEAGARLPAGIYWVRMRVDGTWLGARCIVLLY